MTFILMFFNIIWPKFSEKKLRLCIYTWKQAWSRIHVGNTRANNGHPVVPKVI